MALPTQTETYRATLGVMIDGEIRRIPEIKKRAGELFDMTEEERNIVTSSGVLAWQSRVGWAIQHLARAGLFDRLSEGIYRVNQEGIEVYNRNLNPSEMAALLNAYIKERNPWNTSKKPASSGAESNQTTPKPAPAPEPQEEKSPVEQIDDLVGTLNDTLGEDLLSMIMDQDPDFFEKLCVDLIEAMGYGRGVVTQHSNDGGIDGMISTDELGFRPIYTQAKRYTTNKVSRPDIQKFCGALGKMTNGVFITTSTFTEEAKAAAKEWAHGTIILIDGKRLVDLMIKYNLGVSTERTIQVKRIDTDYFNN